MHEAAHGDTTATMPVDESGRLYHLGLRPGDLCNLVVTVGDEQRARTVAGLFDGAIDTGSAASSIASLANVFAHRSLRGFVTYTGTYRGTPVSVVAIGIV